MKICNTTIGKFFWFWNSVLYVLLLVTVFLSLFLLFLVFKIKTKSSWKKKTPNRRHFQKRRFWRQNHSCTWTGQQQASLPFFILIYLFFILKTKNSRNKDRKTVTSESTYSTEFQNQKNLPMIVLHIFIIESFLIKI